MKFTIDVKTFGEALAELWAIVPGRPSKDVLKYVKVDTGNGVLSLSATDDENSLKVIVEASVEAPGRCLISDRVRSIVRETTGESLTIESVDVGKLKVTSGGGSWNLATDDPATFPEFKTIEGDAVSVEMDALRKAIGRVSYAVDTDSMRYAMGGTLLEAEDGFLTLVATDARRLAVHQIPFSGDDSKHKPVIPLKAVKALSNLKGEECKLHFGEDSVTAHCGDATLTARLIEGRFPRYQDVIPSEFSVKFEMVAGPFLNLVRQSMIVRTEETRGVVFTFKDSELVLSSEAADVGTSKVRAPVQGEDEFDVMLEPQFMVDFLRSISNVDQVEFKGIDGDSAVLFEADGTRYIVMPLARD